MTLKIAQLGQPVLRRRASEVVPAEIGTTAFQQLIQNMLDTLEEAKGAGLAGPQVFASHRIFVAGVLPPSAEDAPPRVEIFINPRITALSSDVVRAWEGCLSFPELLVLVERSRRLRVDYLNRRGEARTLELEDFPARVVQHELDHLNGVLTIDRAPSTRYIIKASEAEAVLEPKKGSGDS
jgi:peptide deformylase